MLKESDASFVPSKAPPTVCPVMALLSPTRKAVPAKIPRQGKRVGTPPSVGGSTFFRPPTPPPASQGEGRGFSLFRSWREGPAGGVEGGHGEWVAPRTPRRLQLLNFWARTRIIQRVLMACVVLWVLLFVYKTSLVDEEGPLPDPAPGRAEEARGPRARVVEEGQRWIQQLVGREEKWTRLAHNHWPTLLGYYNISLEGRYLSILPPIPLSLTVVPDEAVRIRHADEASHQPDWPGHGEPPVDQLLPNQSSPLDLVLQRLTRYPRTTLELVATVLFVIANVLIAAFASIWLYKCVCSRQYAKWRSSWGRRSRRPAPYTKRIREALPIVLHGHRQEVECVVTDGPLVVSSCLGGQVRVWDSATGEPLTCIQRQNILPLSPPLSREPAPGRNVDDSDADLYAEYHEKPSDAVAQPSPPLGASPPVFFSPSSGLSTKVTPSVVPPDMRSRSNSSIGSGKVLSMITESCVLLL